MCVCVLGQGNVRHTEQRTENREERERKRERRKVDREEEREQEREREREAGTWISLSHFSFTNSSRKPGRAQMKRFGNGKGRKLGGGNEGFKEMAGNCRRRKGGHFAAESDGEIRR